MTISGSREACQAAKRAIKDLCNKGYSPLIAGGDFSELAMQVPAGSIPEIFGSGVTVIRQIQDACEVHIHVPEARDGQGQVRKITIAGPKEGAKRAKTVVDSIVRYHHHALTHPGVVHAVIPLAQASDVGTIIGRGGSSIKHIQGSTKTRVCV